MAIRNNVFPAFDLFVKPTSIFSDQVWNFLFLNKDECLLLCYVQKKQFYGMEYFIKMTPDSMG